MIFSESEYARAVKSEHLHWYGRAGLDYFSCPVFVGSQVDEPVLWSEIERAKRTENSTAGLGFTITPSKISEIRIQSLRNKGIVHIQGTLEEFSDWLAATFPNGNTPSDIVKLTSVDNRDLLNLTTDDINAAHYLKPVQYNLAREQLAKRTELELAKMGRRFYEGFPPTWELAASDIPVNLQHTDDLYNSLCLAAENREQLFVVTGQAGSGKTTAIMMALLRYVRSHHRKVYKVSGDVRSLRHVLSVLKKLNEPAVLYIGDLFLYGDGLAADVELLKGNDILVVSSARSGEWNEHFSRRLGGVVSPHAFNRFTRDDYHPLLDKLNKYVPLPAFNKLSRQEQLKKIAASRRQLLIALHETTASSNFTDTISTEYEKLPDVDTKRLCLIAGLGTMARVGIGYEFAAAAYERNARRPLDSALSSLEGIVEFTEAKRLIARHEIYVRHIVEHVITLDQFLGVVCDILRVFTDFEVPVIRKVNRTDGFLFKYILNADFVFKIATKHGNPEAGRQVYERFEVEFQLDGHYWLQYGLYLIKCNRYQDALRALIRSIEAYPENLFARHALAHLKMRIASQRQIYDLVTQNLIDEAVTELELEHARTTPTDDQYPLVTLSISHVQVLANHDQHEKAQELARRYHARLQEMGRRVNHLAIQKAEEAMLRYVTLGEVPGRLFGPASPPRSKRR